MSTPNPASPAQPAQPAQAAPRPVIAIPDDEGGDESAPILIYVIAGVLGLVLLLLLLTAGTFVLLSSGQAVALTPTP